MGMSTHKIKGEDYYQCRDVKAERDKLLEEVAELLDRLEAAEKERDDLRARIKEMEQQEPVAWTSSRNGFICKENKNPDYNIPLIHARGAKGE